jgi:hypothetical protein
MAIRTSAIFYRRGVPNSYSNFAFVAQTNNAVVVPMHKYLRNYSFYNRAAINTNNTSFRGAVFPWRN